mmetsp:Transcript_20570/g.36988  ORF Transcript_20570/g.36988 Transcript_20570/m.36988 type:complete len:127 (+) Transcript_20570:258-638(+)
MTSESGKKLKATRPEVQRLVKVAKLIALARICEGNVSAAKIHVIGPMPMEKAATKQQTAATESQAMSSTIAKESPAKHIVIKDVLKIKSGRRPLVSTQHAAKTMKAVLVKPTNIVTANRSASVVAT